MTCSTLHLVNPLFLVYPFTLCPSVRQEPPSSETVAVYLARALSHVKSWSTYNSLTEHMWTCRPAPLIYPCRHYVFHSLMLGKINCNLSSERKLLSSIFHDSSLASSTQVVSIGVWKTNCNTFLKSSYDWAKWSLITSRRHLCFSFVLFC